MVPSLRPSLRHLLLVGRTAGLSSLAPALSPASALLALQASNSSSTPSPFPSTSTSSRGLSSSSAASFAARGGAGELEGGPKAITAYTLFFKQAYPALKAEQPEGSGRVDFAHAARTISARYHALPADQRQALAREADQQSGRASRGPPLPKRVKPFNLFVKEHFKEAAAEAAAAAGGSSSKLEETGAAMKAVGARWKALTPEQQERYKAAADAHNAEHGFPPTPAKQ